MDRTHTVVKRLVIVGSALVVLGLVLGFRPIHQYGASCGTAFFGNSDEGTYYNAFYSDIPDCEGARASARPPAVIFLVLGGGVLAGAWVTAGLAKPNPDPFQVERYFLGRRVDRAGRRDESPDESDQT